MGSPVGDVLLVRGERGDNVPERAERLVDGLRLLQALPGAAALLHPAAVNQEESRVKSGRDQTMRWEQGSEWVRSSHAAVNQEGKESGAAMQR